MTFRVLVPEQISAAGVQVLHAAGMEIVTPPAIGLETMKDAIQDCHALLVRTMQVPSGLLEAAPMLKVVSRHGAGLDNVDLDYCAARGIAVTYAPESNTVAVAEHALMLLLALARNVVTADGEVRRGNFAFRNSHAGIELTGKTLGIIGLGRIGQLVGARAAAGLGMRALGSDPFVDAATVDPIINVVPLQSLLEEANVVSVHVPLSEVTRNLLSVRELARMKQGSLLINCSRGGVVDEAALEDSLKSGHLGGAGLDVFEHEPLPADHPLTNLPNVILTPHTAAHTTESIERMAVHAAQGIVDVAHGKEPQWPVPLPQQTTNQL
ncbi:hydroxyacid dehydrogenase [Arthrobacter pigmenti]